MENLKNRIAEVIKELYAIDGAVVDFADVPADIPGDYSTNAAMRIAKQAGKAPRQIAEEIVERLRQDSDGFIFTIAGPGFINVEISGASLQKQLAQNLQLEFLDMLLKSKFHLVIAPAVKTVFIFALLLKKHLKWLKQKTFWTKKTSSMTN